MRGIGEERGEGRGKVEECGVRQGSRRGTEGRGGRGGSGGAG